MSKYKKGAARITVHDQLHVPLSYTLEASFFGSDVNSSFSLFSNSLENKNAL